MMDYYQQGQNIPEATPTTNLKPKIPKTLNTNVVLYLGELPPDIDQYDLHQFIMAQGKFNIESLAVKPTKENKAYAYVKFKTKLEVEKARKLLNLKVLNNYIIKAEPFRQKENLKDESIKKSTETNPDTNLFVKNLPILTTPRDLYELFSPFGNIISIKLKQNKTGECLGYGYVNFENENSAEEALKKLNDFSYQNKKLYVSVFSSKKEREKTNEDTDDKFPLVLIKQLPEDFCNEKKLEEIFSRFGQISFCGIINNNLSKNHEKSENLEFENSEENLKNLPKFEKIGIIHFNRKEDAVNAVTALNEVILPGSTLPILLTLAPINKETLTKLYTAKKESFRTKYEGCNLVVKNIPKEITERNLFEICKQFGDIAVARVSTEGKMKEIKNENGEILDKEFVYESKGYGFVLFRKSEDALKAKEALNNQQVKFKNWNLSLLVEFYDYTKEKNERNGEKKFNNGNNGVSTGYMGKNPNSNYKKNNTGGNNFNGDRGNFNNGQGQEQNNRGRYRGNNFNPNFSHQQFGQNQNNLQNVNNKLGENNTNEQNVMINNRSVINPKSGPIQNKNQNSGYNNNQNNNRNNQNMHMNRNMMTPNQNNNLVGNNMNRNYMNNNNQVQQNNLNNNTNSSLNQNFFSTPNHMNSQMSQINSQMSQISPFGNVNPNMNNNAESNSNNIQQNNIPTTTSSNKSPQDIEFLTELSKILSGTNSEEKTELLGETVFYYLLRFISKYNLNTSAGRFDDPTLCSKLTGMFLSIEEKDLLEIFSNEEVLIMTINDVLMQLLKAAVEN